MLKFELTNNWSSNHYWSHYYINTYPDGRGAKRLVKQGTTNDCREFFVKLYREKINKFGGFTAWALKTYALTTPGGSHSSTFESWNTRFQNNAEKGLHIVNSFEKAHKWPLTRIYQVDARTRDGRRFPAVFWSGPRKWTTSPYLMSIWSLCIRLGRNDWLPKKLMTLSHENMVREIAIAGRCQDGCGDSHQVSTIRQWDPFLSLYKDLFSGHSRKYHWSLDRLFPMGKNDRPEGIMKLLDGSTGHKELNKKYYALKKEKKLNDT